MATSSITKRARIGSNSCPKCDVDLSECEGVVLCSVCEINFCITCAKVPLEMLTFMNSGASNVLSRGLSSKSILVWWHVDKVDFAWCRAF